jgi:hypothetical protein
MYGPCQDRPELTWMRRTGVIAIAVLASTAAFVASRAAAANSSQPTGVQLSLHAAPDVLSVTVSPSSGTFGSCTGGDSTSAGELGFPNGTCHVTGLVIKNTGLPGHLMVTGAPMVPVGSATAWALCGASDGTTPSCQRPGYPGADQYILTNINPAALRTGLPGTLNLSDQPQCDIAFGAGRCGVSPGQSSTENVTLTGPRSTSGGAGSYITTITWTVTP